MTVLAGLRILPEVHLFSRIFLGITIDQYIFPPLKMAMIEARFFQTTALLVKYIQVFPVQSQFCLMNIPSFEHPQAFCVQVRPWNTSAQRMHWTSRSRSPWCWCRITCASDLTGEWDEANGAG